MKTRKRLLALGFAAMGSALLMPGTAFAAHGNIQSLQVDSTAVLSGGTVRVTGTITCTTAATSAMWRVGARLTQPDGDSARSGPDIGTCNGSAQPFTVFITPSGADSFEVGPGNVKASAQTGDNTGTVLDRAETSQAVTVS